MSADTVVGLELRKPGPDRTARGNGYRHRDIDTRVGTIDVQILKLHPSTYFPDWLLERREKAEAAMITAVADCYPAGVSNRRTDRLVRTLGINSSCKPQVSRMAARLDEQVERVSHRPIGDAGPFTFVAADALAMKVREGGRVTGAVMLVATGVNADGLREVLGLLAATSETGAARTRSSPTSSREEYLRFASSPRTPTLGSWKRSQRTCLELPGRDTAPITPRT